MKLVSVSQVVVLLSMLLLLTPLFFPTANAAATMGGLGQYLNFTIHATAESKIGENIFVDMTFTSSYDFVDITPRDYFLSIERLTVLFNGANVTLYKTWSNIKLKSWESIRANATLKPSTEGSILCEVWASYNYTYQGSANVGFSWGGFTFPLTTVRTTTYNELLNTQNLLVVSVAVLSLATLASIASTVYIARRKPKTA